MTYLDSSAIVKRYVAEKGTLYVRHLFSRHKPVATSQVAYFEIHSALARLRRENLFSASQYTAACKSFDAEFERFNVLNLSNEVFAISRRLAAKHILKALDLIHLASAVHLYGRFGTLLSFAGADRQLLRAAEAEGLRVVDVETVAPQHA